jgi:hypothetical protein
MGVIHKLQRALTSHLELLIGKVEACYIPHRAMKLRYLCGLNQ